MFDASVVDYCAIDRGCYQCLSVKESGVGKSVGKSKSVVDEVQRSKRGEKARQEILASARAEFSEHGLSGARVDTIAMRVNTAKRMIYYYFGSKVGLYLAVLEEAYGDIRRFETELDLDQYPPVEALCRLVDFTFEYDEAHPEFIRLVSTENKHYAKHIPRSSTIKEVNQSVIAILHRVLERGKREGLFSPEVDPVDVHLLMSSFCFFRISNRHTFDALFGRDLLDPAQRTRHKRMLLEAVLNAVRRM
jgi:AcrR family transcriptional regulator